MTYDNRLIPQPQSITMLSDHTICVGTSVVSNIRSKHRAVKNAFREISYFLSRRVCRPCVSAGTTVYLELSNTPSTEMAYPEEGYSITTSYERITVTGYGPIGLYYGVLTLIQLAEPRGVDHYVPHVKVLDWPATKIRGLAIDSDAASMTLEDWRKILHLISKQKMNSLFINSNLFSENPALFEKIIGHGNDHCVSILTPGDMKVHDMSGFSNSCAEDALSKHAEIVWTSGRK